MRMIKVTCEVRDCHTGFMYDSFISCFRRVQRKFTVHSKADGRSILFGETPRTIRLRQFTEMSEAQGYKSTVEFARAVVSGDRTMRMRMLMEYYKKKEYPEECIESFSQTLSQELNASKNPKENEKFNKTKTSANRIKHFKTSSARQTSFRKVSKAPVVKPSKSRRLEKKRIRYLETTAESSKVSKVKPQQKIDGSESSGCSKLEDEGTVLPQNNADKSRSSIVDNVEHKNDKKQSVGSGHVEPNSGVLPSKESGDSLASVASDCKESTKADAKTSKGITSCAVSSSNADNTCEDILNDILTACCDRNTGRSKNSFSPDNKRPSKTSSLSDTRQDDAQSSSFLDEFLFECSQRTNRTENALSPRQKPSNAVNATRLVEKTNSYDKMPTSIIDDLI